MIAWIIVDVSTSVILLDAHLDLGRGPEAGEDLPDLPGDVHGGEDLVVHGRVRGLTDSLRVAMNSHRHEDDGQHRDGGHPDMRTLLTALTVSHSRRVSAFLISTQLTTGLRPRRGRPHTTLS